jgi:hypothetical protein
MSLASGSARPPRLPGDAKVKVSGTVTLGTLHEMRQVNVAGPDARFAFSSALPSDGTLSSVDVAQVVTRASALPADQLHWKLEEGTGTAAISGSGLAESYMIFGGPGSGKTYLLMYLLRQLFALGATDPEARVGGLILDPKAALIEEVQDMLARAGRLDDLVVLNAETLARAGDAVNIVDTGLDPVELGAMLVLAAQSAGTEASEPFWFGLWTTLFQAAVPVLLWRDEVRLTLDSLMDAVLENEVDASGRSVRRLQRVARQARAALGELSPEARGDMEMALDEIDAFYAMEAKSTGAVETLMRRAYSGFRRSKWKCFSAAQPNIPGAARVPFYDQIIDEGKIVLVSVSPSDPQMAKVICTLVKVLFQRTVLSRLDRVRSGALRNFTRVLVMAVDEYSAVASEIEGQPMGDGYFLAQCRQNGCMAVLATQSVNLLQSSSLKDKWKSVVSTCAAKIYMRLADNETAEEATKLAGEYDWYLGSRGTSQQKDGAGSSTNTELRERKALPAAVLTQVLMRGQGAIVGSLDGKETADSLRFFKCPKWK